jgi:hypothetical protein
MISEQIKKILIDLLIYCIFMRLGRFFSMLCNIHTRTTKKGGSNNKNRILFVRLFSMHLLLISLALHTCTLKRNSTKSCVNKSITTLPSIFSAHTHNSAHPRDFDNFSTSKIIKSNNRNN